MYYVLAVVIAIYILVSCAYLGDIICILYIGNLKIYKYKIHYIT